MALAMAVLRLVTRDFDGGVIFPWRSQKALGPLPALELISRF